MNAIETKGLTKQYKDVTAVDSLDLAVASGELFALLGVNGAGKTTTIKMLSCLTAPTSGMASVNGHDVTSDSAAVKREIAISPQESAVAPGLTAAENLELMCGVHGFDKAKSKAKIAEMLDTFDLRKVEKKKAGKLSGGMQRRLSIAMALVSEPSVLYLDEPTLGLDVIARADLWDAIRALRGKVTIILTTHYMEEAEALSDRVGIMRDGHLLTVGTADEIKAATGCDKFEDAFVSIVRGGEAK